MIDGLKPYPVIKDSGVPWLGKVPEPWEVQRLKHISTLHGRIGFHGLSSNDYRSVGVFVVSGIDFSNWGVDWERCNRISEDWYEKDKNIQLREGDLLVTKDGTIGKTAVVRNLPGRAVLNSGVIIVRPRLRKQYVNRYLLYLINSRAFDAFIDIVRTGATIHHLYEATFNNFVVALPSLDEQEAIVRLLNDAERRIGHLIRAKQKMIGLLEEQKHAIIYEAVTRGLDQNSQFKPSGVEWLGDIPEHWKVQRLGRLARVFNGTTPSRTEPAYWQNGTVPWLSSGKVNDYVVQTPSELVTERALRECSISIIPKGAVIIGLVGQGKTRAKSAILGIDACINQNLAAIIPQRELDGRYLHHFLTAFYKVLREFGRGGNQEALNCEIVSNFRVSVPPFDEQQRICDFITLSRAGIETAQQRMDREIALIREFRTRLIVDVVTGKIDVREAAARLPAEVKDAEPLDEIDDVPQDESTVGDEEFAAVDAA